MGKSDSYGADGKSTVEGAPLVVERESYVLAAMGLALCIAIPEASRYTALWSTDAPLASLSTVAKAAFLVVLALIVRHVAKRSFRLLYQHRAIPVLLALLQTCGFSLLAAASFGVALPPWTSVLRSTLLESSLLLFPVFVSFYARTSVRTAVSSFVLAVIVAGTTQICMALLPVTVAVGCVFAFAPLSIVLLRLADRRTRVDTCWYLSLPERDRGVFADECDDPCPPKRRTDRDNLPSRAALYATIALLSFAVAAIHLSWQGVRDDEGMAVLVQVCAGIGAVLAGNILLAMRRTLEDSEMFELTRLAVLSLLAGTLYFASLLSGSFVVLVTIPLNIVYVAVLLLAWLAPFAYAETRDPTVVSCDAFLAKRLGVVIGVRLMGEATSMGLDWLSGAMVVASLGGLIALNVGQLLWLARRRRSSEDEGPDRVQLDGEEIRDRACASVGGRYRLTPREQEVLGLLVRGRTASYIAEALFISGTTAKTHIKHIYQKTGVQSKQELLDIVEEEQKVIAG